MKKKIKITIPILLRIPIDLHKELKKAVLETYGSRNQFIVEAIHLSIKQYKKDKETL